MIGLEDNPTTWGLNCESKSGEFFSSVYSGFTV